jgi:hypothetical protein
MTSLQLRQHLITDADDALDQEARHDRELVAERLGVPQIDVWCLAAADDIEQARPIDETRHCGDFVLGLRRLDEDDVGAGAQGRVGAGYRLVEAGDGSRVGARDNRKVLVAAGGNRSTDLCQVILAGDDLLAFEMAAFFREFLVLDVDPRNTAAFEFPHRTKDVELVAITGVGISDHRHLDCGDQTAGIGYHLRHRDEAEIGVSQTRRGAGAGHVDGRKPRLFDQPGGNAVVSAGGNDHPMLT